MTAPGSAFVTYLWHYVLARLFYDDLVRPLERGHVTTALVLVAVIAVVGFGMGRRRGRRA
jgi:hypothetical protein